MYLWSLCDVFIYLDIVKWESHATHYLIYSTEDNYLITEHV